MGLRALIFLAGKLLLRLRAGRRRLVRRGYDVAIDAGVETVATDDADARGDGIAVAPGETLGRDRPSLLRQRQDRGDPGRFGRAHRTRIMAEIPLRTGIHAIGADACLGEVEINLPDPTLGPEMLDQKGEPG